MCSCLLRCVLYLCVRYLCIWSPLLFQQVVSGLAGAKMCPPCSPTDVLQVRVCVCVCVRSPWILPFELFTDMEQGWALQHAAGQQYGNWYHFFSLWLCFVGRLDNLHVKVGFGVCAFLLKLSWGFITYRLEQFLWKYSASLRVEIKTTAGGAQLSRRWWWWVWSECAVTSLNMNCFQLQLWEPQEDGERSRTGRTFFFLFFFYWHW